MQEKGSVYKSFTASLRSNYLYVLLGVFLFILFSSAIYTGFGFMYDVYIHTSRNVMGESVTATLQERERVSYSEDSNYKVLKGYSKGEINESLVDSFYLSWPVKGGEGIVTQCYHEEHPAVDIADYRSPKILASADGEVILADCFTEDCPKPGDLGGEGLAHTVMIEHENGFITVYGHLSSIDVTEGQRVTRGDVIGIMGKSGEVDIISDDGEGIHLHFALIKDKSWDYLNPADFLLKEICYKGEVDPEALYGIDDEIEEPKGNEKIPLDFSDIAGDEDPLDEQTEDEVIPPEQEEETEVEQEESFEENIIKVEP